jgi:hypothetical protein
MCLKFKHFLIFFFFVYSFENTPNDDITLCDENFEKLRICHGQSHHILLMLFWKESRGHYVKRGDSGWLNVH